LQLVVVVALPLLLLLPPVLLPLLLPLVITDFSHPPFVVRVSLPALVLGLCPYSPAPFVCIRYIVSIQLIIILLTFKNKDH
jgi:hypothetical protein